MKMTLKKSLCNMRWLRKRLYQVLWQKSPTEAASSADDPQRPPVEEVQDDFLISTSILEKKSFWVQLIESILHQDEQGIDPLRMDFSPEGKYVFQQLNPQCTGCG